VREGGGVHPAVADPAGELEALGQLVGIGLDGDRAVAGADLGEVGGEDVDRGVGWGRVVVHCWEYAPPGVADGDR
jgi:hypothetical protein